MGGPTSGCGRVVDRRSIRPTSSTGRSTPPADRTSFCPATAAGRCAGRPLPHLGASPSAGHWGATSGGSPCRPRGRGVQGVSLRESVCLAPECAPPHGRPHEVLPRHREPRRDSGNRCLGHPGWSHHESVPHCQGGQGLRGDDPRNLHHREGSGLGRSGRRNTGRDGQAGTAPGSASRRRGGQGSPDRGGDLGDLPTLGRRHSGQCHPVFPGQPGAGGCQGRRCLHFPVCRSA